MARLGLKKGGGGVFLREITPMLLMWLGLAVVTWRDLCAFATLFVTFWRGRSGWAGGLDDFSGIFLHGVCPLGDYFYCALLGVNCLQTWPVYFGEVSGLFCWV